ncbi:MAG: hypothetical protein DRK00_03265 [Thermoprotei archaeon]|nr:MAG: hypothetical protein DRK00_03265 [Thermoprotei archaeon]
MGGEAEAIIRGAPGELRVSRIELCLENVGPFRGSHEFTFERGLNLIYGPNASGKSAIIRALIVACVSSALSEDEVDVLNNYEISGRVRLRVGDQKYWIELARQPDGGVHVKGDPYIKVKAARIVRLIAFADRLNPLVASILRGDEAQATAMLRDAVGLARLEEAAASLEREILSLEKRLEELSAERGEVLSRMSEAGQRIKELEASIRSSAPTVEAAGLRLKEALAEREKLEARLEQVRGELEELEKKLREVEEKRFDVSLRQRELRSLRQQLQERISKLHSKLPERRKRLIELEEEKRKLEREMEKLGERLKAVKEEKERRLSVRDEAKCPYCGQPIDRSWIDREVERLRELENKLVNERIRLGRRISDLNVEISDLKEEIEEEIERSKRELRRVDAELAEAERDSRRLREKASRLKKRIGELVEEKARVEGRLKALNEGLQELGVTAEMLEELMAKRAELEALRKERNALARRLRELEEEEGKLRERLKRQKDLKAAVEARLAELREDVAEEVNEAVMRHFELLKLAELEPPILSRDLTFRLVRRGGVPTRLSQLSDSERAILAVAVTFVLKLHAIPWFPIYAVDNYVANSIHEKALFPLLEYLMERSKRRGVVTVVAVHGPPTNRRGLEIYANEEALRVLKFTPEGISGGDGGQSKQPGQQGGAGLQQ